MFWYLALVNKPDIKMHIHILQLRKVKIDIEEFFYAIVFTF